MTTRMEWRQLRTQAHDLYAQGKSKAEIFDQLCGDGIKSTRLAAMVAGIPHPQSLTRYRWSRYIVAVFLFLLGLISGFDAIASLYGALGDQHTVIVALKDTVLGIIFIGLGWGILKSSYDSYGAAVILLTFSLFFTIRAMLGLFAHSDVSEGDFAWIVVCFTAYVLLLRHILRLRSNIFSKVGYWGLPKKDKNGSYQFFSAWELPKVSIIRRVLSFLIDAFLVIVMASFILAGMDPSADAPMYSDQGQAVSP